MRHLYGVALAVLFTAALFFGAAWGYMLVTDGVDASMAASGGPAGGGVLPAGGGSLFQNMHVMAGGGALLAVGLAAGLLMMIRWVSPLAAGLPGLALVAWTVLFVSDVREAVRLIPLKNHDFGAGFEALLFTGLLGAAGLAMIVPLFIPSRWRRPPRVPGYAALGESTLAQAAALSPEPGATAETDDSDLSPAIVGVVVPSAGSRAPSDPPDQG